jgi:hypothetical protein
VGEQEADHLRKPVVVLERPAVHLVIEAHEDRRVRVEALDRAKEHP